MSHCLLFMLVVTLAFACSHAVPVFGVVSGPDGKPVAAARVILEGYTGKTVAAVQTDGAGKFTAEIAPIPTEFATNLPIKYFGRITVYASGCALFGQALQPGENTIQLQKGGIFSGRVVDGLGKPVAGAMVTPRRLRASLDNRSWYIRIPTELESTFTVKTGTDGVYKIPDVPSEGRISVELSDPRFVRVFAESIISPENIPAKPLIARPGATLTGKVVFADGKPAAGIQVFANTPNYRQEGGYARDVSAVDGSFRLAGLSSGAVFIKLYEMPAQWTAVAVTDITATEGQVTAVKNLVLIAGGIVEGTITDAETGKGVPGVYLNIYNMLSKMYPAASTATDTAGHYSLRVPSGKYRLLLSPNVMGYCLPHDGINVDVSIADAETKQVPFKLSKGLSLSGIALDEAGKPATEVPLQVNILKNQTGNETSWGDQTAQGITDAEGKFTISGLTAGKAKITASQYNEVGMWEIVKGQQVQLPADKPISITVRNVIMRKLTVHTVTPDGKPLPNTTVVMELYTPLGSGMGTGDRQDSISDAQGCFTLQLRPESTVSVISVERTGYQFVRGGKMTKQGTGFQIDDIVLAPMGSKLSGVVVDVQDGKPVAGAKVITDSLPTPVVTDAKGRFTLTNLPDSDVVVFAVHGRAGGMQVGRAQHGNGGADPITIAIVATEQPKPVDIERGAAVLERIWKESQGTDYYARENIPLELQRVAPERAKKLVDGNQQTTEIATAFAIEEAIKHDPSHLADLVPSLDKILTPDMKTFALAEVALAVVDTQPELAAKMYTQLKGVMGDEWQGQLRRNVYLCKLAVKLKNGEADGFFAKVTDTLRKHPDDELGYGAFVAEGLVDASPELARKVSDSLPPAQRADAYCRMVQAIARKDVKLAQTLLNELEGMQDRNAEWNYGRAAKSVIVALGKTDFAGALALARKVPGEYHPAALSLAAQFAPRDTALKLLREAVNGAQPAEMPRYAAQAFVLDPMVGKELFAAAREALNRDEHVEGPATAAFAFFYGAVDPEDSRLLLEQEYVKRNSIKEKLALAMTAIDVERALVMAQGIPETNGRFDTQRKIAQYLLATDEVRRTLAFDRWGASDTWTPGEETGW